MVRSLRLFLLAALPAALQAARLARTAEAGKANPIRKVVTMLQAMQKKVTEEGEKEKELYEKFMCYCRTSGGDLTGAISAGEAKAPQLVSDIESSTEQKAQLEEALKQAQVDRSDAKEAVAEATQAEKAGDKELQAAGKPGLKPLFLVRSDLLRWSLSRYDSKWSSTKAPEGAGLSQSSRMSLPVERRTYDLELLARIAEKGIQSWKERVSVVRYLRQHGLAPGVRVKFCVDFEENRGRPYAANWEMVTPPSFDEYRTRSRSRQTRRRSPFDDFLSAAAEDRAATAGLQNVRAWHGGRYKV